MSLKILLIDIKIKLVELDNSKSKVDVNKLANYENYLREALAYLSRLNPLLYEHLNGPQLIIPFVPHFTAFPQVTPPEPGYFDRGLWFPN